MLGILFEKSKYLVNGDFCTGSFDESGFYVLLSHLAAVAVPKKHGTLGLNKIFSFDTAEVTGVNVGQLNAITVSSFCGPNGKVAGYDFLRTDPQKIMDFHGVGVFDGSNLLEATKQIIGTVEEPVCPIKPGSLLPCAMKEFYLDGPGEIYVTSSVCIPVNKDQKARLLMEDVGIKSMPKEFYIESMVKSIIDIGKNQDFVCREIYINFRSVKVGENEMGCALAMFPYVKLPKKLMNYID